MYRIDVKSGMQFCSMIVAGTLIAGCGGGHAADKSQVVAKVNDKEVTVSQLNQVLDSMNPASVTPEITKSAIETLVDEEILVQEAIKNKLDRDPLSVAAIEKARRQILAQAYAERMLIPKQPINVNEQEKYYQAHPALFEHRRLYRMSIYSVKQSDVTPALMAALDATHSADQVRDVLEKHQIKFETQISSAPAEELPIEKLDQFAKAGAGDLLVAQQSDGKSLLISIVGTEDKPLSFERSKAMIEQYLLRERNSSAVKEHLKARRATDSITYMGEFAKLGEPVKK